MTERVLAVPTATSLMFRFLSQWWRLNGQSLPDRDTVPSGSKVGERQLQWSWWLGEIAYGLYINVFLNIFSGIDETRLSKRLLAKIFS
jgi:hypothetical protein